MKEFWQGWWECILQHRVAGALMYADIATVTCQGGTDFSDILTLKRLFDALASVSDGRRLFFWLLQRQRNLVGCRICVARKTFSKAAQSTRTQGWNRCRCLSKTVSLARTAGAARSLLFSSNIFFESKPALMFRINLEVDLKRGKRKLNIMH